MNIGFATHRHVIFAVRCMRTAAIVMGFLLFDAAFPSGAIAQTPIVIANPSIPLANNAFGIDIQYVDVGNPLTITTDAPNVHDGFIDLTAHIKRGTGSTSPAPYEVSFIVPGVDAGAYTIRYYTYNATGVPESGPILQSSTPLTVVLGPQIGLWWNPNESGTGYSFDIKHGVLVATIYSYTEQGPPIWYLAFGPIDSNHTVTSPLYKYTNGQCISCAYVPPLDNGNDGNVTITFTSPTSATMTLPNRAPFTIVPQDF